MAGPRILAFSALCGLGGATAWADCIPVAATPVVLTAPGAYCLAGDLQYSGAGTAITIGAPDVELDLGGHTLSGPANRSALTVGIQSSHRSGVRITNGRIEGFRIGIFHAGEPFQPGPSIQGVRLESIHYVGIYADGPGTTVQGCHVLGVGGSLVQGDRIPVGIYVFGHGARIDHNVVAEVRLPLGPGTEAVGIALGNAVPSSISDNVIVNTDLVPHTWAIWLSVPTDTSVRANFIAGYQYGIAFSGGTAGGYGSNTFMNVITPVEVRPEAVAADEGGNRSLRAHCRPVYELPFTIAEQGRYCVVRNLSTNMVAGSAIEIASDHVVLEMGGFKVGGGSAGPATETFGVHAVNRRNVVVRGGNVRGFRRAVFLEETEPGTSGGHVVERVLADSNTEAGIHVTGAHVLVRRNQVVNVGGAAGPGPDAVAIRVEGPLARVSANEVSSADPQDGARLLGIHVVGGAGAVVESNRVTLDPVPGSTAILLEDSTDTLAVANRVVRAQAGIVYEGGSSGKYRDNLTVGVAAPFSGGTDAGGNN